LNVLGDDNSPWGKGFTTTDLRFLISKMDMMKKSTMQDS
jgi:hypothetical protein